MRRIVCFGDSITGPHPSQARSYQSGFLKYSDILQCLLNSGLAAPAWEVINCGWAGSKASGGPDHPNADARSRTEILPLEPEIVTVLIGGNDMAPSSPATHGTCEDALMALGKTLTEVQKVCVMLYPQAMPDPANQATAWHHLSQANPFLKNMAERYGFSILDLDPVFRLAAKHHCRGQLFDPVDGVHLRPVGELIIASSLSRLINIWQEPA